MLASRFRALSVFSNLSEFLVPAFEKLNGPLVLFGPFASAERAEVSALARLGIDLPRIEPVLA
jgi:hypothetical protein